MKPFVTLLLYVIDWYTDGVDSCNTSVSKDWMPLS